MKNSRNHLFLTALFSIMLIVLSGCTAIEGVFKAGMWVGVIVVVAIVALVLWLIGKARNK